MWYLIWIIYAAFAVYIGVRVTRSVGND